MCFQLKGADSTAHETIQDELYVTGIDEHTALGIEREGARYIEANLVSAVRHFPV